MSSQLRRPTPLSGSSLETLADENAANGCGSDISTASSPTSNALVWYFLCSSLGTLVVSTALAYNAIAPQDALKVGLVILVLAGLAELSGRLTSNAAMRLLLLMALLLLAPFVPCLVPALWLASFGGLCMLYAGRRSRPPRLAVISAAFALFAICTYNHYANFQLGSQLASGTISLDTLFHSAIAAMFREHGVASVGMDGLVPIRYHTFSHKIVAGLSSLSLLPTIKVYSYLIFCIAPPVLILSLQLLAKNLRPKANDLRLMLGMIALAWLHKHLPTLENAGVFWDSSFSSFSFTLALCCMAVMLSTLQVYLKKGGRRHLLVICGVLCVIAGMCKISVGFTCITALFFLGFLKGRSQRWFFGVCVFLTAAALYVSTVAIYKAGASNMAFRPFHFFEVYGYFANNVILSFGFFVLLFYLPVWVCFARGFNTMGKAYLASFDFIMLSSTLVSTLLLTVLFYFHSGAEYYFFSVPMYLSLGILVAGLVGCVPRINKSMIAVGLLLILRLDRAQIYNKSCIGEKRGLWRTDQGLANILQQIEEARTTLPTDCAVMVKNVAALTDLIGYRAFWLLPALLERPILNGAPPQPQDLGTGGYGLGDYQYASGGLNTPLPKRELELLPPPPEKRRLLK